MLSPLENPMVDKRLGEPFKLITAIDRNRLGA